MQYRILAASAATLAALPSTMAILIRTCDLGGAVSIFNLTADVAELSVRSEAFVSVRAMAFDDTRGLVYALDVNDDKINGTLYVLDSETLTTLGNVTTPVDPTWGLVFGDDNSGLAVPAYLGSAFATYNVSDPTAPFAVQASGYTVEGGTAHPHHAILDPSGQYLIVPDLGADLVRTLHLDGLNYEELETMAVATGTGPRHGVFTTTSAGASLFYLLGETASTITGYTVSYESDGAAPTFTEVYTSSTHGLGNTADADATGGDIHVSPDGNFLLVSSRYDTTSNNATNPTGSGPLITFSIDQASGNLTLVQQWAIGGSLSAEFAIDPSGTLVAMGFQDQTIMKVANRDPATGLLLDEAASFNVTGRLMGVTFDTTA